MSENEWQFLNIKTLKIICLYIHPPYFLNIFSLYPITEVKKMAKTFLSESQF